MSETKGKTPLCSRAYEFRRLRTERTKRQIHSYGVQSNRIIFEHNLRHRKVLCGVNDSRNAAKRLERRKSRLVYLVAQSTRRACLFRVCLGRRFKRFLVGIFGYIGQQARLSALQRMQVRYRRQRLFQGFGRHRVRTLQGT